MWNQMSLQAMETYCVVFGGRVFALKCHGWEQVWSDSIIQLLARFGNDSRMKRRPRYA